jgi:trigger factor
MSIQVKEAEKNVREFELEISAADFDEAIQKAYKKNLKNFNIPGFRKGKVPFKMVEQYYGKAVLYDDAINFAFPAAYDAAIKETGLEPVDRPEVDIKELEDGKPVVLTVKVTVKPTVKLGDYKGIEVEKAEYNVSDADVEKELDIKREQNARVIDIDDRAVENGDIANIDYEGFLDGVPFEGGKGEGHKLTIGSGQFIPGFEEQLIGKNIGEEFDINVTFPEEYHAEELKGKPAVFKVKINGISKRELPELDDEFAKDVSEKDTLDELKAEIKEELEKKAKDTADAQNRNNVIDKILENVEVEVPEVMVEAQIDNIMRDFEMRLSYSGMKLEQYLQYTGSDLVKFREQFKEQAEKQVKTSLMLEEVAKVEKVEATQEEIDTELSKMAEQYKMEMDKIRELIQGEYLDSLKNDIAINKTVDMLVESANLK